MRPHRLAAPLTVALLTAALPAATGATGATGAFHPNFVRPPIVPLERDSDGHPAFDVYAKLDHAVPRTKSGGLAASLVLIDAGEGDSVSTLSRTSHCYADGIDTTFSTSKILEHPHVGVRVRVRLLVGDRIAQTTYVRLSKPLKPRGENADTPYLRALGCR